MIAIDPGTEQSGVVYYENDNVTYADIMPNAEVVKHLDSNWKQRVAIELVQPMGMPLGMSTVWTVLWTGRFVEAAGTETDVRWIHRTTIKADLCASTRAKDANVRQALIDLFPATGGGKSPRLAPRSNLDRSTASSRTYGQRWPLASSQETIGIS
jgi:hypothetical protein